MRVMIGRTVAILALALLFFAYSNFAPNSLSSDLIADYVKNHFVREMIFGATLTLIAIRLSFKVDTLKHWARFGLLGSIVVLPFWIAAFFGWSTDGLAEVWGGAIDENAAFMLHGPQTIGFYIGLLLMYPGTNKVDVA
jgi:hypothetical protein